MEKETEVVMEKETEVTTVRVDKTCEKCGKGKMRPTGVMLTSMPPWYPHVCTNKDCGAKANYRRSYPFIKHKPKEDNDNG